MFLNQRAIIQSAVLSATASTLYTAPANTVAKLASVTFSNQSSTAAVAVSVHLVKAGDSPSPANRVVAPYVLAPYEAWTCPHLYHNLNAGDTLQALADTAGVISVYGSASEMSKG